jgi:hypothetical protein
MAKTYRTTFTVRGAYPFPIDMLRYDRCVPEHETDSCTIAASHFRGGTDGPFSVSLAHECERKNWTPTEGRWNSFSWVVDQRTIETRQVP